MKQRKRRRKKRRRALGSWKVLCGHPAETGKDRGVADKMPFDGEPEFALCCRRRRWHRPIAPTQPNWLVARTITCGELLNWADPPRVQCVLFNVTAPLHRSLHRPLHRPARLGRCTKSRRGVTLRPLGAIVSSLECFLPSWAS